MRTCAMSTEKAGASASITCAGIWEGYNPQKGIHRRAAMMDAEGACAQLPEFAVPHEIPRFGIVRAARESISRYHAVFRACQN